MSQVVVGNLKVYERWRFGEAVLMGRLRSFGRQKCGDLRMTRVLEMGAMTEIAERDG